MVAYRAVFVEPDHLPRKRMDDGSPSVYLTFVLPFKRIEHRLPRHLLDIGSVGANKNRQHDRRLPDHRRHRRWLNRSVLPGIHGARISPGPTLTTSRHPTVSLP